jgi:hypothetical protein
MRSDLDIRVAGPNWCQFLFWRFKRQDVKHETNYLASDAGVIILEASKVQARAAASAVRLNKGWPYKISVAVTLPVLLTSTTTATAPCVQVARAIGGYFGTTIVTGCMGFKS